MSRKSALPTLQRWDPYATQHSKNIPHKDEGLPSTFATDKPGSRSWTGARSDNPFGQNSSSSSTASTPTDEDEPCQVCERPRVPLFCFACGFFVSNGRIRRPCTMHPKVVFYTDFATCPKCKKESLSELP